MPAPFKKMDTWMLIDLLERIETRLTALKHAAAARKANILRRRPSKPRRRIVSARRGNPPVRIGDRGKM